MAEVDEETLFNRASFAKLRKTEAGFLAFSLALKFRFLIGSIYEPMESLKTQKLQLPSVSIQFGTKVDNSNLRLLKLNKDLLEKIENGQD